MSDPNDPITPPEPPPASPPPPPPASPPPPAPPPPSSGGATPGSKPNAVMLVLAYLGPLALIPFVTEKEDTNVQWHAKHGLVLFAAEIVLWIGLFIVNLVVTAIFAPLGCLLTIFGLFLGIAILVLHVICIVKALNGEKVLIPYVSEYADSF